MKRIFTHELGLEFSHSPGTHAAAPVLAPDGLRFAVTGRSERRFVVVVDDRHFGPFEPGAYGVAPRRPKFSADSRRFAFVVAARGREALVVDGDSHPRQRVSELAFAPAGGRFGAITRARGGWTVEVDGLRSTAGLRSAEQLAFSPDGGHAAFLARKGNAFAVLDGVAGAPFDALWELAVGLDGRAGFCARRKGKAFVVVDGAAFGPFAEAGRLVFDPSGRHWTAYGRAAAGGCAVLVDGEEVARTAKQVQSLTWSSDSDALYVEVDGRKDSDVLRIEGDGVRSFDRGVRRLWCGPEGRVLVEKDAGRLRTFLQLDGGRRIGPFDYGPSELRFSPDGKRLAFNATRDGRAVMVVDGEAHGPWERVSNPVYVARKKIRWLGVEGGALSLFEA